MSEILPETIIEGIRDYIRTYTGLKEGAPVWVERLGNEPTEYAVLPLAGRRVVAEYITGKRVMEYSFAFRSMESTADDLVRMENNGFYESFAQWLDDQTDAGDLPGLPAGMYAEGIEALGQGFLFQEGNSDTGIYQVQCRLVYEQN